MNNYLKELEEFGVLRINEPLKNHSTWKIGGEADALIVVEDSGKLSALIRQLYDNLIPYIVIGQGSNLLFSDQGYRGIVIKLLNKKAKISIDHEIIIADAGVYVPFLSKKALDAGLSGIEHTIGIPGTLGGLIWMNGGSMRKGIGDNVVTVSAINSEGQLLELSKEECEFKYRSSIFQKSNYIITRVTLKLSVGNKTIMRDEMINILKDRNKKFPRKLPNCGSVFVSDPALYQMIGPPGKVIESLGLKGFRIGDAVISSQHANFIINDGEASAKSVLELIKFVHDKVLTATNISMRVEAKYVDENKGIIPIDDLIKTRL